MANRAWRNELNNRSYMYNSYGGQMGYQSNYNERRFNPGYARDDYGSRRGKREFPGRLDGGGDAKRGRDNQSGPRRNMKDKPSDKVMLKSQRYNVKVPKYTFNLKEGSYSSLKARYPRLYVPSDFFHSDFRWQDVFQLHAQMELGKKAGYQIFSKDVEPLEAFDSEKCDPADANYIYSAKVMLINQPDKAELLKCVTEGSGNILRTVQFLVGTKGKNESMAIGGPWSPSLDGPNPDEDPQVLINTAIRTCKQLTGIDLTSCREWHRFIEFHYYRPADRQGLASANAELNENTNAMDKESEEYRVETVVVFVPSVWDCMPDTTKWEQIKTKYADNLDKALNPPLPEPNVEIIDAEDSKDVDDKAEMEVDEKKEAKEETEGKADEPATKEEEEKTEKVEEVKAEVDKSEPVTISDKEKKRLERIYKPVENPVIPVHPNKLAKNGKFDCQVMSLSSLLEYKSEDQKESTFEVSVFAEQFYEMIHRDSAFKIYKTLLMVPSQTESKEDGTDAEKAKGSLEDNLHMAFGIYDLDNAGYVREHDLEDIIHSIGLDLARSQVRKLIGKAVGRKGSFSYKETTIQENLNTLTDLELSKGNKVNLCISSDGDTVYMDNKQVTGLKIKSLDNEIKRIEAEFNKKKVEMDKIRKIYHDSMDLENGLRRELKDLENELHSERKNVRDVGQQHGLYNSLMCMTRDVLERAKNKIDRQFEKDAEREKSKTVESTGIVPNGTD